MAGLPRCQRAADALLIAGFQRFQPETHRQPNLNHPLRYIRIKIMKFHLEIYKNMIILDKKIEVPLNIFLNTVYGASMSLYLNYKGKVDNSNGILDEFKTELDSFKRILF